MSAGRVEGRAGRRIGRYLVTGRIGRGGMGLVYRAFDEVLERELAVKILTAEAGESEEHRQRFAIEAKAAAKLQHPNIVTVFELGEDRGVPFIAMELLSGVDLEALLKSGESLLLEEKLDIAIQVCRGLHYAHERRIVHRDVKPSNIRVLEDGTAKILDFGIAKLGATAVTRIGMMVGTVHYMSPEQVRGQALDGRSDVFSVGVILFQLLCGRRPFHGDSATAILYKIVHEATPPLEGDLGEAGPALTQLVSRALAKDPAERYPSASALADDLSRVLGAHLRSPLRALPADSLESLTLGRRLLAEGRVEESLARLREVTARHPDAIEARRALRTATREMERRETASQAAAPAEGFPELEATFRPAETMAAPVTPAPLTDTRLQPTVLQPSPLPAPSRPAITLPLGIAGGALALAAVFGTAFLVRKPAPTPTPPTAPSAAASPEVVSPSSPVELASPARGGTSRSSAAGPSPMATGSGASVAAVATPEAEPAGPVGRVTLASSYPVDVLWRGRVLVKGQQSAELSLPLGRQTLTLVSAENFLRANVNVDVTAEGPTEISAPSLGRINIRAQPDNCQIFIDGAFIDYPPILDRPLSTGPHQVLFRWPDGASREEQVEVSRGAPAYVTGRKE
jgi:serine/threonine-protein kinase